MSQPHDRSEVLARLREQIEQLESSDEPRRGMHDDPSQYSATDGVAPWAPVGEDQAQRARQILLRTLSATPKTRKQLADKLASQEIPADVAEKVLDRFEEVQLIDDAAFARSWVESRQRSKGLAKTALARELHDKGIVGETAEQALELIDDDQQYQRGVELVERKLARKSVPGTTIAEDRRERDKLVRRMVGMLGRKGYAPSMAFSIVKRVLEEKETDS
ncbi:regulatory protein RecX [Auritidibacter sp. NML100628]|uniref:regulatory protein RecX n=1 Tax=Auritidibacter sp. NML100628 TaxID=2170742 RepID=UPI001F42696A|nr:regulatory protein RecX [Auritidibacter sp. NML100628]